MRDKPYYSIRHGTNPGPRTLDLPTLLRLFRPLYSHFEEEGYFQEAFGYHCVDAGPVSGSLGFDMEGVLLLELRKPDLWPVLEKLDSYTQDDLFDIIEFLHEHCSKPIERTFHSWSNCGWHCSSFEQAPGRAEFRGKVDRLLRVYQDGYELSADGEVLTLPEEGLEALLEAPLPTVDPANVESRIESARRKFRRYRSSLDERRDAVRDLADVLEFLRPQVKQVLTSPDERDLFHLANTFGIRHHNDDQKTGFDRSVWYSWMFYYYLATIHAVTRLIAKGGR